MRHRVNHTAESWINVVLYVATVMHVELNKTQIEYATTFLKLPPVTECKVCHVELGTGMTRVVAAKGQTDVCLDCANFSHF